MIITYSRTNDKVKTETGKMKAHEEKSDLTQGKVDSNNQPKMK